MNSVEDGLGIQGVPRGLAEGLLGSSDHGGQRGAVVLSRVPTHLEGTWQPGNISDGSDGEGAIGQRLGTMAALL